MESHARGEKRKGDRTICPVLNVSPKFRFAMGCNFKKETQKRNGGGRKKEGGKTDPSPTQMLKHMGGDRKRKACCNFDVGMNSPEVHNGEGKAAGQTQGCPTLDSSRKGGRQKERRWKCQKKRGKDLPATLARHVPVETDENDGESRERGGAWVPDEQKRQPRQTRFPQRKRVDQTLSGPKKGLNFTTPARKGRLQLWMRGRW